MESDISKIDLVLHYSLLVAGEEDDFPSRQLGPIHLIKYVYMADLLHSERRDGKIFTNVDWRFHKFGPWSQTVNDRIEPAMQVIGARRDSFDSRYKEDDEFFRWSLTNERLLEEKQRALPVFIAAPLKQLIHRFGKDTPSLLEHVYRSSPILKASPNEMLDFTHGDHLRISEPTPQYAEDLDSLAHKRHKAFIEKRKLLRSRLNNAKASNLLVNPVPNPRYDEVYEAGLEQLESLAGEKIAPFKGIAVFKDSVWKSEARKSDDIP